MAAPRSVRMEADGGSRGNPGPAAYGAVLFDAETGEVIAQRAACLGVATNNVAEYNGLIAGLELHAEHTPEAELEVAMDSKLVVEQMSGRWKIKHPDMKPLASRAHSLAPFGTTYRWIPRELNTYADRILNEALDAEAGKAPRRRREAAPSTAPSASRGWSPDAVTTTLILVRHGVTAHTVDKRFSGGLAGQNPGLSEEGRDQLRRAGDWLAPLAEQVDVLVSSPVRRTRESAEILGARLEKPVELDDGLAEMEFGRWEGLTFAEVRERFPDEVTAWFASFDHAPGGGESFRTVEKRVLASLTAILAAHPGKTVLAVSHVTPIKVLVARALGAPLDTLHRMELAPASVTVLAFYDDGRASMRMFNARPTAD